MDKHNLTVSEFCRWANISRSTLYKLFAEQDGPTVIRIGRRVLIPVGAAENWMRQRESVFQPG
ncbi:MAG: helix-turn-helix domain-containing protein [Rhodospirillales bacterium]